MYFKKTFPFSGTDVIESLRYDCFGSTDPSKKSISVSTQKNKNKKSGLPRPGHFQKKEKIPRAWKFPKKAQNKNKK